MNRLGTQIAMLLAVTAMMTSVAFGQDKKPNVVLILADDVGFSDFQPWGSEIPTPNIDALSKSGVTFTNFRNSPVCSVTRGMVLTGVYAEKIGLGTFVDAPYAPYVDKPGYEGWLTGSAATTAEILGAAGYNTFMVGKWHLGTKDNQSPHARGFQETYTLLQGGGNHFNQKGFLFSTPVSQYRQNGKLVERPSGVYSSDLWNEKMIGMIDKHKGDDKPFFAYVCYTCAHWPMQAPKEDIDKFIGKYDMGWDKLREQRFKRMQAEGLITPGNKTLPPINPIVPKWDSLSAEEQKYQSKKMSIYAAMVHNLDRHIGELIDHLKEIGEYENTVILFASDNGAAPTAVTGPTSNPELTRWIQLYFDNSYDNLGSATSLETNGPNWGQASVTPLNWWKVWVANGGTQVPFVIRVPGNKKNGTRTDAMAHHIDMAATVLDAAGVPHPGTEFQGRKVFAMQGKSILPFLNGKTDRIHSAEEPLGFELLGSKALIQDYWKITFISKGMAGDSKWHLYNLKQDMAEQFPLEEKYPDRLQAMIAAYGQWAKDNNVLTIPPDWNPYTAVGK